MALWEIKHLYLWNAEDWILSNISQNSSEKTEQRNLSDSLQIWVQVQFSTFKTNKQINKEQQQQKVEK